MRTENQVFSQILDFAKAEESVRAVMLNGSRLNQNSPRDRWQDYDIVFLIRDLANSKYKAEQGWIQQFGELVIMQVNSEECGYQFLMQFKDIDLEVHDDSLSKMLLDKDNLVPELPEPNDSKYHTAKPTAQEFAELLNEAWWIQPYIAKGILRDELPYAKYAFDVVLLGCIRQLLCWYIGSENNWSVNPGYNEKWLKRFLPKEIYDEFVSLFPSTNYVEMWDSLFRTGDFIHKIGIHLTEKLTYFYPLQDDTNVREYLQKLRIAEETRVQILETRVERKMEDSRKEHGV
jgi:aminoglycoside 6-adenylyltransferase